MNVNARPWGSLNWPNRISLMRLLLVAPFVALLLNQHDWPWARHASLWIFVVMAASDFADGVIARRMGLKTRLGAILDPLADKVLIICSVVLLSIHDYAPRMAAGDQNPVFEIPKWVAVAVVGKDLWVILGTVVVYLVTDRLRVYPTWAGKISTVVQLAMVICVLLVPDLESFRAGLGVTLAWALCWLVAAMAVAAVVSYTRLGLSFIAHEQKPLDEARRARLKDAANEQHRGNP